MSRYVVDASVGIKMNYRQRNISSLRGLTQKRLQIMQIEKRSPINQSSPQGIKHQAVALRVVSRES
jgi:hypothetical protein